MNDLQDIKQTIASEDKETRLQALREALEYQQPGLKLVRANLNDIEAQPVLNITSIITIEFILIFLSQVLPFVPLSE
ncbi:MAG: hypothetical protein WBF90_38285 [Rivularia sp. (in: cyanobacteria)]